MRGATQPDSLGLDIAVVGGGASGTLTAVQLLRRAALRQLPLRVTLIDRHGRHGLGQAYSTDDQAHLLNAMAGQMSALPDDPDHLVRWAGVSRSTFLPRCRYGQYLQETLAAAERQAHPVATLARVGSDVVAIRRSRDGQALRLILADGYIDADVAVLATGNTAAPLPFPVPVPATSRIIADPWLPGALDAVTDGSPVVIVGTGLTMLDLAISIAGQSPSAQIHAVSRHRLPPRPHPGTLPAGRQIWLPVMSRTAGPVRLSELMWQLRSCMAANPANWHDIIDAIRPLIPGLWRRMPASDKRLFLRHIAR